MAYASQDDIIRRYSEGDLLVIADRDNDSVPDADVVARALDDATAEIDTYVAAKYSLPLPSVPEVLVRICVDIAVYRLSTDAAQATDERRLRFEDAMSMLKDISKGIASLGIATPPPSSNGKAVMVGQPRRFNRGGMRRLT